MNRKQVLAAMVLLAAGAAGAQTIYRCGNSYGDEPCPGASVVEPPRKPSEQEIVAARDEVRREAKLAAEMHAERAKQEAAEHASTPPTPKSHGVRGSAARAVVLGPGRNAKTKDAKPKTAKKNEGAAISRPASRQPAAAGTSATGSPASR